MRRRTGYCIRALSPVLLLAACGTPFSDKLLEMDWSDRPVAGTITVSQPKMYQRASLINERRREKEWLDDEIGKSRGQTFQPEIIREVEQITALAGALGYSVDPASALSYRRSSETGALQQQIDVLELQVQLDKLKQQMRTAPAAQAGTGTGDSAKPATDGAPGQGAGTVSAQQLKTLTDAVTALTAALLGKHDGDITKSNSTAPDGESPKGTGTASPTANPADVFRDRSAFRGLLNAALSAAGLDDLHDYAGGALVRLNFQALVLPDRPHSRAPAVVQMTVKQPTLSQSDRVRIYSGWLAHINQQLNRKADAGWTPNGELLSSAAADNFDLVQYAYELNAGTAAGASSPACSGFVLKSGSIDKRCGMLTFAVPKFGGVSPQEDVYVSLQEKLAWFYPAQSDSQDQLRYEELHGLISANAKSIVRHCVLERPLDPVPGDALVLYTGVGEAKTRIAVAAPLEKIEQLTERILFPGKIKDAKNEGFIHTRAARARQFLAAFQAAAFGHCPVSAVAAFAGIAPPIFVPPGFQAALGGSGRIAVYEIGPREQVQQVSSASRVAHSVAVALALAASAPSSGRAMSAASQYARQASGKAAAVERVPALIGYSLADRNTSSQTFGWVIGPEATFDPNGALKLEQTPRPLDLSVDLSIPSWWPWFTVEISSVWSPRVESIVAGNIAITGQKPAVVKVEMATNYADYEVLTARLKLGGLNEDRQVAFDDGELRGQAVDACRTTTVLIQGPHIWRADTVLIGGNRLDNTAISVTPDMSGILLTVPPMDGIQADAKRTIPVTVFTRYRSASGRIAYVAKPVPGGCSPGEKVPPANAPPANAPPVTVPPANVLPAHS